MQFTAHTRLLAPVTKLLPPSAMDVFLVSANASLSALLDENEAIKAGWSAVRERWCRPRIGKRWVLKDDAGADASGSGPTSSAVHVEVPLGGSRKKRNQVEKDGGKSTLMVKRPVLNGEDIRSWAADQGFKSTLPADDMHVTLAYSKKPFDHSSVEPDETPMVVPATANNRKVAPLGADGAVVLHFKHAPLSDRHQEIKDAGASWDYPTFRPHMTLTYDPGEVDTSKVKPYDGPLVLGAEQHRPIQPNWHDNLEEDAVKHFDSVVCKVDAALGLVFGFGIVCTKGGQPYWDLQDDHIPEATMLKAATDFMQANRISGDMHARSGDGQPVMDGTVVFAFPLTADIAKAMEIQTANTGLMIGIKPSADVLSKFASGEYTGFSIGGHRLEDETVD